MYGTGFQKPALPEMISRLSRVCVQEFVYVIGKCRKAVRQNEELENAASKSRFSFGKIRARNASRIYKYSHQIQRLQPFVSVNLSGTTLRRLTTKTENNLDYSETSIINPSVLNPTRL